MRDHSWVAISCKVQGMLRRVQNEEMTPAREQNRKQPRMGPLHAWHGQAIVIAVRQGHERTTLSKLDLDSFTFLQFTV